MYLIISNVTLNGIFTRIIITILLLFCIGIMWKMNDNNLWKYGINLYIKITKLKWKLTSALQLEYENKWWLIKKDKSFVLYNICLMPYRILIHMLHMIIKMRVLGIRKTIKQEKDVWWLITILLSIISLNIWVFISMLVIWYLEKQVLNGSEIEDINRWLWIGWSEKLKVEKKYKDLLVLIDRINDVYDWMRHTYVYEYSAKINSARFIIRFLFINTETHCFTENDKRSEEELAESPFNGKITDWFFTEKSEKVLEKIDDDPHMCSVCELREELKENKNRLDIDDTHRKFIIEVESKIDELYQFLIENIEILQQNEKETKELLQLWIKEYSPRNFWKREETKKIEYILNKKNGI